MGHGEEVGLHYVEGERKVTAVRTFGVFLSTAISRIVGHKLILQIGESVHLGREIRGGMARNDVHGGLRLGDLWKKRIRPPRTMGDP